MSERIRHRFSLSGPRWAGIKSFLRELAWPYPQLDLKIEEDKGLLRTHIYCTIEGPRDMVIAYLDCVSEAIDAYEGY